MSNKDKAIILSNGGMKIYFDGEGEVLLHQFYATDGTNYLSTPNSP